ncbi:MAG: tetratricopeptide repeat protein [Candidatus Zixiibacteriota bacterium]|nr:MAG: tetratricopeptide repeat protein [candidate division Zixibacteria bacterium]
MASNKVKRTRKKQSGKALPPDVRQDCRPVVDRTGSIETLLQTVESDPHNIHARLALADAYLRTNLETEIIQTLLPLHDRYPFEDQISNRLYNRLLALGYAHVGQLNQAEETCHRGLRDEPDGLDYHFVLCFVHLSLREYDKAIEFGRRYLDLREALLSQNKAAMDYSTSHSHLSQIQNSVGSAHFEKASWNEAIEYFEASIQADPGNHLPYINLVNLAKHHKDPDSARQIIERGLKHCRQVQELRMLGNSLDTSATVSACMIVKDEEELLPGCLESIRDWVDEIIIVDTGSTDRTVEIAESYGARIFHQPWEGNFSKHRNYSLELATCDWIFIIDADERFVQEDLPQLRRLLNDEEYGILSINVFNVYGSSEELTTFLPSVRFWRRKLNLRYEGIVHNLLKLGEEHPVLRAAVRLKHLGYGLGAERMGKKFIRTKTLLENQLDENPDNFFALFNYAQLLKGEDQNYAVMNIPTIIKSASRAVELTDPSKKDQRPIHLMCLDQIAWANYFDKSYDEALKYCERALATKPDYLDPLLLEGHIYGRKEQWDEAFEAYHKYLEAQKAYDPAKETDCLILTHIDSRANAYYGLALISEVRDDNERAKEYYLAALDAQSGHIDANLRLANLYFSEGDFENAIRYFQRQSALSQNSVESAIGLATAYYRMGDNEKAESCFASAIEQNPSHAGLRNRYAQFLLQRGEESLAAEQFQAVVEMGGGTGETYQRLAETYFQLERYCEAIKAYRQVLDSERPSAELLNDLGNCYFKMKQYEEAEGHYLHALECDGSHTLTYRNLGLAQVGLEKYPEALSALERYSQNVSDGMDVLPIMGDVCFKMGQHERALEYYERYLAKNPTAASVLHRLSDCYLHMGHRDSAIIGYRRVLQIDPAFELARQRLDSLMEKAPQI